MTEKERVDELLSGLIEGRELFRKGLEASGSLMDTLYFAAYTELVEFIQIVRDSQDYSHKSAYAIYIINNLIESLHKSALASLEEDKEPEPEPESVKYVSNPLVNQLFQKYKR